MSKPWNLVMRSCVGAFMLVAASWAQAQSDKPVEVNKPKLNDTPRTAAPLAWNACLKESLVEGEVDYFRLRGQAGDVIQVDVDPHIVVGRALSDLAADLTVRIEILDAQGNVLSQDSGNFVLDDPSLHGVALPPVPGGEYLVRVTSSGWVRSGEVGYLLRTCREDGRFEVEPNNSRARASLVELDTVVGGFLATDTIDPADFYRFQGEAGHNLTVKVSLEDGTLAPFAIDVIDGVGRVLASSGQNTQGLKDHTLVFRSPADATYYLRVVQFGLAGVTPYRVTISSDLSTSPAIYFRSEVEPNDLQLEANPIAVGDAVEGFIATADVDSWTFSASAGDVIAVDISARPTDIGSDLDATLRILDSSGVEVALNDDGPGGGLDPFIDFEAPANDAYTVQVSGFNGTSEGEYLLTLTRGIQVILSGLPSESEPNGDLASANAVSLGDRVAGVIDSEGDVDFFSFTVGGPATVTIDVDATQDGSALDSSLELFDDGGNSIEADDDDDDYFLDSIILNATLPSAGTYFFAVSAFFGGGANHTYTVSVQVTGASGIVEVEPNDEILTATPAAIGSSASGVINPAGDVDFFSFSGNAGDTVRLDIDAGGLIQPPSPSTLDSVLELFDPNGDPIAFNDDGGSEDSDLTLTLPVNGTYAVSVRAFEDGGSPTDTYDLGISRFHDSTAILPDTVEVEPNDDSSTATFIGLDALGSGVIDEDDTDFFSFEAQAGDVILIDVTAAPFGSSLDSVIEVFDPSDASLATNDDGGDGALDSFVIFQAPVGGTYAVQISDFSGSGGPRHYYTLHIVEGDLILGVGDPTPPRGGPLGMQILGHPNDHICLLFGFQAGRNEIPDAGVLGILDPAVLLGITLPDTGELSFVTDLPPNLAGVVYGQLISVRGLNQFFDEVSEVVSIDIQ